MKILNRWWALLLAAVLLFPASSLAAGIVGETYSDAPGNATQENVDHILAEYRSLHEESVPFSIRVIEPTKLTVDTLHELFDFVEINHRPPARYFPEKTWLEIQEIIGGMDPDSLYAPEFMSLLPEEMKLDMDVFVDVQMNIDYKEGQLVVPVLGRETENGIYWKALPGDVVANNVIRFVIPREEMVHFAGQEMLFVVLALKPGSGESGKIEDVDTIEVFVPSKSITDIIYVVDEKTYSLSGEELECEIIIVPRTPVIEEELKKMTEYFTHPEKKPIRYFDEDTINEAELVLKGMDVDLLIPYEITQVMAIKYKEPYGDVMARFTFPTPFEEGQRMIAMIGLPDAEDVFYWMPLHAEKKNGFVEITFSSSVLPAMMKDAGILLMMSEPFSE